MANVFYFIFAIIKIVQSRKHFSHLPNSTVLSEALTIEAKREVEYSKLDIHYPEFNLFLSWMREIGMDTDFFENPKNWQYLIDAGNQLQKIVADKTISEVKSGNKELVEILEAIEKYLGAQAVIPENIDILFIFGSKDLGRVHKAVTEIFNKHKVKYILIAGGSRYDTQEDFEPEAVVFRQEAIKLGVPSEKIIVESESITVADNVRSGLNLLDTLNIEYKNIVTMISWFAQKRAWAHLKKYTDADIICVNSDPKSKELTPGEWYRNETGVNIIFSEFLKMKMAVLINTA